MHDKHYLHFQSRKLSVEGRLSPSSCTSDLDCLPTQWEGQNKSNCCTHNSNSIKTMNTTKTKIPKFNKMIKKLMYTFHTKKDFTVPASLLSSIVYLQWKIHMNLHLIKHTTSQMSKSLINLHKQGSQ